MKVVVLLLVLLVCSRAGAEKIKVACVGNSITYGSGVLNREKNSYPAQLGAMLGENYEVRNFGVSGSTLLTKGDNPYVRTSDYQKVLEYQPDIVTIKLGTNDSKLRNRGALREFKENYKDLLKSFQQLPSCPRIILLTPIPAFTDPKDTVNITDAVIAGRIIPLLEEIALETGLEIVHLYPLFPKYEWHLVPDRIHPSAIGAGIITRRLYEQIKFEGKDFDLAGNLGLEGTASNFYGYRCTSFVYDGRDCKIVQPKKAAAGNPWVWRARFWGHEPQTDVALLDRGYHIVYCDVSGLFGAPAAVKKWDKFYNLMIRGGLNPKVALEGMSRGGLIVYNWAVENPAKVACVYADAPVLDLKSWPLGVGTHKPSAGDVEELLNAYGFKDKQEALKYKKNPLDRAARIAKAGFPMLHVCGDADDVVPVSENTNPFEQEVLKNGGNIRVVHKAGVNHHPHSLKNPEAIVSFILKATGHGVDFAVIPAPGNEFRSGAGWKEGCEWWKNQDEISELLQDKQIDLLLLGNSITQATGGNRQTVTHRPGFEAVNRVMPAVTWECAGISGDRTEHVLFRILYGKYETRAPKNVALTIGVNNLVTAGHSPAETAAGIEKCVDALLQKMPASNIIVFGTFPAGVDANGELRGKIREVNRILARTLRDKPVTYADLHDVFVNPDGSLRAELYSGDHLHLDTKGYEVLCQEIRKYLK